SGFAAGMNEYDLNPLAEKYSGYSPYTYVSSADIFFFGVADGGNGATVTLNVWNDNSGEPGTVLGSSVYNLSDIAAALARNSGQGLINLPLDASVNVGAGPFYVGVSFQNYDIYNGDA